MPDNKKSIKDILQNPKGMRDFLVIENMKKDNFLMLAKNIGSYAGFDSIETPILEHIEIFTKGVGSVTDIIEKEMYTLETKGGDHLALRPEGTAGVMRSYIEHGMGSLPQPVMLSYSGPYFRHEKPQKGRYRQFYQFGLEIIGSDDALYDGYIIETGYKIIKEYTKKNISIKLNTLGNSSSRKLYLEKLSDFYRKNINKISHKDRSRLETNPLRILDSKESETVSLNTSAPTVLEGLDKESLIFFKTVTDYLDKKKIPYHIDNRLVRGLDYYCHTVFEYIVYDTQGTASFALGGGGRYDGLARTMGHTKDVPAVGLGLGVDRIIEISENEPIDYSNDYALVELNTIARVQSSAITDIFRKLKITIHRVCNKKKLSDHLGAIENLGIAFSVIIGENEIKKNTVLIKDMNRHSQIEIRVNELESYLLEK
jgi:histidyl-tRNA synthetase